MMSSDQARCCYQLSQTKVLQAIERDVPEMGWLMATLRMEEDLAAHLTAIQACSLFLDHPALIVF